MKVICRKKTCWKLDDCISKKKKKEKSCFDNISMFIHITFRTQTQKGQKIVYLKGNKKKLKRLSTFS